MTQTVARWLLGFVRFPVTRIVLCVAVVATALNLARGGVNWLYEDALRLGSLPQGTALATIPAILAIHFAYVGYVRLVEARPVTEFSWHGALRELGLGLTVGVALMLGTVGTIAALGHYHIEDVNPWRVLIPTFWTMTGAAYLEELVFRGALFRIVEESLGSWLALLVSGAFFGLAHLGNMNATVHGALAISVEAGILLGAVYILTRRLWFAIALHFAWNYMQGPILGINVSGISIDGLLRSRLTGPDLLSGGALGVEGSIVAVAYCLAAGCICLRMAHAREHFVKPFWRRR